jgi:hypothetical protein
LLKPAATSSPASGGLDIKNGRQYRYLWRSRGNLTVDGAVSGTAEIGDTSCIREFHEERFCQRAGATLRLGAKLIFRVSRETVSDAAPPLSVSICRPARKRLRTSIIWPIQYKYGNRATRSLAFCSFIEDALVGRGVLSSEADFRHRH